MAHIILYYIVFIVSKQKRSFNEPYQNDATRNVSTMSEINSNYTKGQRTYTGNIPANTGYVM